MAGGSCRDLRKYQNDPKVHEAFSKLVSGGKYGYKTVITKDEPKERCSQCHIELEGNEKFCPECGAKTEWQKKAEEPVILLSTEELEEQFKTGKKSENEIFNYMREMLKVPDAVAFDTINKWKNEAKEREEASKPKINLNEFKG